MAAFDALFSLAQTTDPTTNKDIHLFSFAAKEKIKTIHNLVVFLLTFLEQSPEEAKSWEDRFRGVAYNIEYIIEKFICGLNQAQYDRMELLGVRFEEQLNIVMKEIGVIAEQIFDTAVSSSPSTSTLPPIRNSDTVVGLDKDLEVIKNLLCGEPLNRQVIIPIVGMGGIGKTTLATTIYHDPFIRDHFDIWVWLTVSQDYRFRKILSGLVDALKLPQELKSRDESQIKIKVFQHLKFRRYLIIMDDVWGREVWDDVRDMIPDDGNGSRIVFTTRQLDYSACHHMKCMNDSQSWDLLKLKVFSDSNCPPELEEAGKEIARRCAGLPLAVVLVAGFLVNEITLSSWEEIAKSINPVVNGEVEEILSLSYTYLPHHLRPCFLFIGGLEDAYIQTSRLTKLWVAEGFVKHQSNCGKTLEEKAEEYLEELVKRNLLIVASRKSDGKIKRCNLHDLVREVCIRKGRQEKFLSVLDGRDDLPQGLMNERRIIFRCSDIDNLVCPTIHTIQCFQIQNYPAWLASLNYYEVLRVLNAIGIDLTELPSQVFKLYHLRYLALKGSFNIPPDISKLENLETLIIHVASGKLRSMRYGKVESYSLPQEIWRMRQLRHLAFDAPYILSHPPDGLMSSPLENLQTLMLVGNLVWNENIPRMIPNAKRLGLVYTTDKECSIHHLKDLGQLEKLELIGSPSFSWLGEYENTIFPTTLRKLSLVGGVYPWEKMSIIGSLPNLEVLKLLDYACDGDTWETTDGEFNRLHFLLIDKSEIQKWITESSHFPRLKHLVLRSCWNLREIPQEIGDIPTLELIEVDTACTESVLESARQIKQDQEDWGNDTLQVRVAHKLQHDVETEEGKIQEQQQLIIQSLNQSFGLEDQLKNVGDKIGLIAREVADSDHRRRTKPAIAGIHNYDIEEIKNRLCDCEASSSKLQVIPIVGKAGIGKTNLATAAYFDPSVMRHFRIRVWVTVSRDYTPPEIIGQMLDSIKRQRGNLYDSPSEEEVMAQVLGTKIDNTEMAAEVKRMLEGKRYLIVIDNLWSTQVWDDVKNIFPDNYSGSRVLLTTRLADVATYPDSGSPLHQMKLMNGHQSWKLLKEMVFTNGDCPAELEDIGKEIAQGCGELPFPVVLVAGILSAVTRNPASWKKISRNVDLDMQLDEILLLSYIHLPRQLRPCFLFIGGFPENKVIIASTLIKLWVAEGFLEHQNGCSKSLEEEAGEYLETLVKRNLVIATSRICSGKIKRCRLHNMVRDMCLRAIEDEKFRHAMDPATRSIFCLHLRKNPIWIAFSGGFRLLRAWDGGHKKLPSQVFELEDVRYLALRASLNIPPSIANLSNLQTLIIHPTLRPELRDNEDNETASQLSLPAEIWRLSQLRHLNFYDDCMLPHPPDGSNLPLQNLQTLWRVKDLVLSEEILQMIPNVKTLRLVYSDTRGMEQLNNLIRLHQLEKLEIHGFGWRPKQISFPQALKKLTLKGGGLYDLLDEGTIGSFPNLQVLKLCNNGYNPIWRTTKEFHQLKFLEIRNYSLSEWITQSSHFPRLKSLVLHCRSLKKFPQGIGDIPSLELIQFDGDCSISLVRSANQIKKDRESEGKYGLQVLSQFNEDRLNEELDEQP